MGYVALSRVTSLNGLYLIKYEFSEHAIYSNSKVLDYFAVMRSATSLEAWKDVQIPDLQVLTEHLLIVSYNVEGLLPHMHESNNTSFLFQANIICLQENWSTSTQVLNNLLFDYTSILACRQKQYTRSNVPVFEIYWKRRYSIIIYEERYAV